MFFCIDFRFDLIAKYKQKQAKMSIDEEDDKDEEITKIQRLYEDINMSKYKKHHDTAFKLKNVDEKKVKSDLKKASKTSVLKRMTEDELDQLRRDISKFFTKLKNVRKKAKDKKNALTNPAKKKPEKELSEKQE